MTRLPLACLAIAATLSAQGDPVIRPKSGGLGQPIQYEIAGGRALLPFVFVPSLQRGSFPLSAIDPKDTRSLGIGLDLLALLFVGQFDPKGEARFPLPLPSDASLVGGALLQQVLTFPGTGTVFGPISQVAVVPFELPGAWRPSLETMQFARAWHGGIPLRDGKLLVVGGGTGGLLALTAWKSTELYDPATRKFSQGPDLPEERGVFTTSPLPDGRWLLVGGVDAKNDPQTSCVFFDPASNTFSRAPAMKQPRMAHTATVLKDGRVFVAGGLSDLNNALLALGSALKTTEIYDPGTNSWTSGPDMKIPRAGHTVELLADGRALILGGVTWTLPILPFFAKNVDRFDPTANRIDAVRAMSTERAAHASTLLPGGRVLIAGGVSGTALTGGTAIALVEVYDVAADTWSAGPALSSARGLMAGLRLRDGQFVVLGGANGSLLSPIAQPDCEAFDSVANRWNKLPNLTTPRATQLAVELESCLLLVIGGGTGPTGTATQTQEMLYR